MIGFSWDESMTAIYLPIENISFASGVEAVALNDYIGLHRSDPTLERALPILAQEMNEIRCQLQGAEMLGLPMPRGSIELGEVHTYARILCAQNSTPKATETAVGAVTNHWLEVFQTIWMMLRITLRVPAQNEVLLIIPSESGNGCPYFQISDWGPNWLGQSPPVAIKMSDIPSLRTVWSRLDSIYDVSKLITEQPAQRPDDQTTEPAFSTFLPWSARGDKENPLRVPIDFYLRSCQLPSTEALLVLTGGLESIFLMADETTELTERLCTRIAWFLAGEATVGDRRSWAESARTLYRQRSEIIHGSPKNHDYMGPLLLAEKILSTALCRILQDDCLYMLFTRRRKSSKSSPRREFLERLSFGEGSPEVIAKSVVSASERD